MNKTPQLLNRLNFVEM